VRIVRESELLGSEIFTQRTREAVVYGAKFMREDLPYFAELLAEVATETKYQDYMFKEVIDPITTEAHHKFLNDTAAIALNSAHGLAFHRGLGNSLYPSSHVSPLKYIQAAEIEAYGATAYSKPNFALVASGVDQGELSKWVGEFFSSVPSSAPAGLPALETQGSKFYGGEERISHAGGNTIVIAFPGTSLATGKAYKPEFEVLATLLGGVPSVKWSAGTSILAKAIAPHLGVTARADVAKYSDAGLLTVTLKGPSKNLGAAAKDVVSAIKSLSSGSISKDDFKKAAAQAKFAAYHAETADAPALDLIGLSALANGKVQAADESLKTLTSISESAVQQAAKKLLSGKVAVSTVGELAELPFAEDLGLNV